MLLNDIRLMHLIQNEFCVACVPREECVECFLYVCVCLCLPTKKKSVFSACFFFFFLNGRADSAALCGTLRRRMFIGVEGLTGQAARRPVVSPVQCPKIEL